jgi:N-acetylneuraminate synthase
VNDKLFVIAEAGVNHNGRLELAMELVDRAAAAGADAVKFQTFKAETLVTKSAQKADYQARAMAGDGGSDQLGMLKMLELDHAAHVKIAARCTERGIEFMSTPFDVESVTMLSDMGMHHFKVPSGEIDNPLLLRAMSKTGKPLIVSTGMSTLADVENALRIIASVIAEGAGPDPFFTEAGLSALRERVTLLHCTTEYPAPPESVNLRAMQTMAQAFGLPIGYSDHTEGAAISCAAVAMGATVIEKHFTTDRKLPGPDHKASLEPNELVDFVRSLRAVHAALGDGRKVPAAAEIKNRLVARRSVVAKTEIKKGDAYTTDNLTLKRPGTGIPASRYDELLGRKADRDYAADDLIER